MQETVQNREMNIDQGNIPQGEIMPETIPNTETIKPIVTPSVETTNYEMGRDYSVTKNTKKNIRNKTSTGSLTGTEIPTL